jgi:hypothetical protein
MTMRVLFTFALACSLLACKSKKNAMTDINAVQNDAIKITAEIGTTKEVSAPIEITGCKIEGNKMFLSVTYSGGCQEHSFKMIGSPSIAKSLPPIRSVQLFHQNNGDSCREFISKVIEIDIKALAYVQQKGSVIYLKVEGWEEQLTYTYED